MTPVTTPPVQRLKEICHDLHALDSALSVLNWDRQVLMPAGGGSGRSEQVLRLTQMRHAIATSSEIGDLLAKASGEAESQEDLALIRVMARDYGQQTKLPADLVAKKAKLSGEAYDVWRVAKPENDFARLAPYLAELFDIAKETAEVLGYQDHPYDALIDLYEEGSTYAEARELFDELKPASVELLRQIRESHVKVDDHSITGEWDQAKLRSVVETVVRDIGFDFDRGRLDLAANAFCAGTTRDDVRMTTRPSDHIKGVLSSSLHEMGHALYEQHQNPAWAGLPISGGVSLAVHESQSRTWENVIGRSRPFWVHFWPRFQEAFGHLSLISAEDFYRSYNKVEPSFIRVGADEISYNLHILVRFELEVELITNQISVKDLPEAWNQKYTDYLGITPPTDTLGCLQDVHWCRGSVGYFPTYTMGNLIGVQIWDRLRKDIPNTDDLMRAGNFAPILDWLAGHLYQKGSVTQPKPLIRELIGQELSAKPWLSYARNKFGALYGIHTS